MSDAAGEHASRTKFAIPDAPVLPRTHAASSASVAKQVRKPLLEILQAVFAHGPNTFQALHLAECWPKEYPEERLKRERQQPDYLMLSRIVTYEYHVTKRMAERVLDRDEERTLIRRRLLLKRAADVRAKKIEEETEKLKAKPGVRLPEPREGGGFPDEEQRYLDGDDSARIHDATLLAGLDEVFEADVQPYRDRAAQLDKELKTFLAKDASPGRERWLKDKVRRFREAGLLPRAAPPPYSGKLWRDPLDFAIEDRQEKIEALRREKQKRRLAKRKRDLGACPERASEDQLRLSASVQGRRSLGQRTVERVR